MTNVTKPFNPLEIAARIKARLRRKQALTEGTSIRTEPQSSNRYEFDVKRTNNFQCVEWGINITDGKQEVG